MAASRKLQGEIERCLKKVQEGVETFEDIWQKVHNATNNNQKEKYEADLKKEIKKLQRLRDQIKSWIASGEIKDKTILMENRRLIETQMERFKVVERETKTKAYSKEGLGAAQKLDPAQREKEEIIAWLQNSISELQIQTDSYESEIESLLAAKKKRLAKEAQEKFDDCKAKLERHKFHITKLETLLRMLDNDSVDVDQIKKIKDDVEYYIESSQEPDFEENEYIYDDITGLDEMELDVIGGIPSVDTTESNNSNGIGSPTSMGSITSPPASPTLNCSSTTVSISAPPTQQNHDSTPLDSSQSDSKAKKLDSTTSSTKVTPVKPKAIHPTLKTTPQPVKPVSTKPVVTPTPPQLLQPQPQLPSQQTTAPIAFSTVAKASVETILAPPPPVVVQNSVQPLENHVINSISNCVSPTSSRTSPTPPNVTSPPQAPAPEPQQQQQQLVILKAPEVVEQQQQNNSFVQEPVPNQNGLNNANINNMLGPVVKASGTNEAIIPPLLGVAPLGPSPLQKEHQVQFQMMESAYYHLPAPSDSEKIKGYLHRQPILTPLHYPQTQLPHADTIEFFQRLSTETLFFIFYYMEGTKAQYLTAKALKRQSWRFHTKYMMWFQRFEEPKIINEDFEQGTYIYFDYEKWAQRKKEGFTFEYKYLEDKELN
jgi:CCR4-NOT transcription complex subunit 3